MKSILQTRNLIPITLIWLFYLKRSLSNSNCTILYCSQCDTDNIICLECQLKFSLNPDTNTCKSNCLNGTYYDHTMDECVSICSSGSTYDQSHNACIQIEQCHQLSSPMNLVFKYNKKAQIYKNLIIVSGSQDLKVNENTLSIFSYDWNKGSQLYSLGYLSQNGGPIICFHISLNKFNQDLIYSVTKSQIVLYELNSGIQKNSFVLENGLFVDNNIFYIDNDYLFTFYQRNQQFAILRYQQLLNYECQDLNQQNCLILFPKIHNNAISGYILDSQDYVISYGPDGMIIRWKISDQSHTFILQNDSYQIFNLCLSINESNIQTFYFSSKEDNQYLLYFINGSKLQSISAGHSSNLIEIINYNEIDQLQADFNKDEVILITRSINKLVIVRIELNQEKIFSIIFSIEINPILTKLFTNHFYLIVQLDGLYQLYRNIQTNEFSLKLIKQLSLDKYQFISDIVLFENNPLNSPHSNFLLVGSYLKIIDSVTQNLQDGYYEIEAQVSSFYKKHSQTVNGVLYDNSLRLYITYSEDGAFAIYDTFKYHLFKYKSLFFVFPPWCYLYQNCDTGIKKAIIIKRGVLICLYSNQKIISWSYSRKGVSLRQSYQFNQQMQVIKTFKLYQERYLILSNTQEIQIYDLDQSEINLINTNYQHISDQIQKIELAIDNNFLYLLELVLLSNNDSYDQWVLRLRQLSNYQVINLINLSQEAIDLEYYDSSKIVFVNVKQENINVFHFPSLAKIDVINNDNYNKWLHTFCYSWQKNFILTINASGKMIQWAFNPSLSQYFIYTQIEIPTPRYNYQLLEKNQMIATNSGFIMYQNSQSQFIDNQVIGMEYDYLRPCFVYPFKNEITGISITTDFMLFVSFSNGELFFAPYNCQNSRYTTPQGVSNTTQIYHNQYQRKSYLFYYSQVTNLLQILSFKLDYLKNCLKQNNNQISIQDYYGKKIDYIYNYPHKENTFKAIQDETNFFLITYSKEEKTNLCKFSQITYTWQEFLDGHPYSVSHAFLDLDEDLLVTFSDDPRDLTLILWRYSSLSKLSINQEIKTYTNSNLSASVVNLIHFQQQKKIFIQLIDGALFSFDYIKQTYIQLKSDTGVINFWIDENSFTLFILIAPYYLQIRDINSFQLKSQLIYSNVIINPQDFMYSTKYLFIFLENVVSIISRYTLKEVRQIVCQQPCKDACYSEKLDLLFLYSAYESDSILIYQATSGTFLYSYYGQSDLNKGLISSIILDDEDYLLIIGKLNNFITSFFNFLTLQEVGYYYDRCVQYKNSAYISELNTFIITQFYFFRPISIQEMIIGTFKFQDFYIIKQMDYYINSKKEIFYVDGDNIVRRYNQENQQATIITQLPLYRDILYHQSFIFLLQYDKIIKLQEDLTSISNIEPFVMEGYNILGIYNEFIYIQTLQFQIIKLDTSNLNLNFSIQNSAFIQQFQFVEEKDELIFICEDNSFFIYNYSSNSLISTLSSSYKYYTFFYDLSINLFIIANYQQIDFFTYTQQQPGISDTTVISQLFPDQIDYFWIDNHFLKLYIVYKLERKIDIYQMKTNQQHIISIQFVYYIPIFPTFQSVQLTIQGDYLRVLLPWSIIYYKRDNHKYLRKIQDQAFIQSIRKFIVDANYPEIIFLPQNQFLAIARQDQSTYEIQLLIKLIIYYPEIIKITIQKNDSYFINLLILTKGDIINYSFSLDENGLFNAEKQNQCQLIIPDPSIGFQVENSLSQLKNYFQATNSLDYQPNFIVNQFLILTLLSTMISFYKYIKQQKNFVRGYVFFSLQNIFYQINQIKGAKFLFYSNIMNDLYSTVVYEGDQINTEIELNETSFLKNKLKSINIKDIQFKVNEKSESILFHPFTKFFQLLNTQISQQDSQIPLKTSIQLRNFERINLSNLIIENIQLSQDSIFMNFDSCDEIMLHNISIKNVLMQKNSTLFRFSSVQNLQISQISIKNVRYSDDKSQNQITNSIFIMNKIKYFSIQNSTFENLDGNEQSTIFIMRQNLQTILQGLRVDYLSRIQFARIQNYGESSELTYIQKEDTFLIDNSSFNNYFNSKDSCIVYQGSSLKISNSMFQNAECLTCSGSMIQIQNTNKILIQLSVFKLNKGYNGGSLSLINCLSDNILIDQTKFQKNLANFSGGAIYLFKSNINIQNTEFSENVAYIGGSIRYLKYQPNIFKYQQFQQQQVNFTGNQAFIHSQNWGSYPQSVQVYLIYQENNRNLEIIDHQNIRITEISEAFSLKNIQSGGFINLIFQLLDEEQNKIEYDPQNCLNQKYNDDLCQELKQIKIVLKPFDDSKIRVLGSYITKFSDFRREKSSFEIKGVQLIGEPSTTQIILINVIGITTFLNNFESQQQFNLSVQTSFRECIQGEIYKKSNNMYECYPCPVGSYTILKPNKDEIQECIRCPNEADYCEKNQITLKQGYWKSSNSSVLIYQCQFDKSCQGNQTTDYCSQGHSGPLCQFCDESGIIWGSQFQYSGSNTCIECSNLSLFRSLGYTLLICISLLFYCIFNIFSMMQSSEKISLAYYLRKLKLACVSNSCYVKNQSNMSIKALTNFMQMLKIIQAPSLTLPFAISFMPDLFGSPATSLVFTSACSLQKLQTETIKPLFIKLIITSFSPFIYVISLILVYVTINHFRKYIKSSKSKLINIIVFVFWFLQPNIVSSLIQSISCKDFDGKKYIQLDYTYECYSKVHLTFLYVLLLPSLLFYVILVPGYILIKIIKFKNQLDNVFVRLRFGSLLTLIIQLIYFVLLIQVKPYLILNYQKIEERSSIVLLFISLLNLAQYNNDQNQQNIIFQILLYCPYYLNIGLLLYQLFTTLIFNQIKKTLQKFLNCFQRLSYKEKCPKKEESIKNKQRSLLLWKQIYRNFQIHYLQQSLKQDHQNEDFKKYFSQTQQQQQEKQFLSSPQFTKSGEFAKHFLALQHKRLNFKKYNFINTKSFNLYNQKISNVEQSHTSTLIKESHLENCFSNNSSEDLYTIKQYPLLDSLSETNDIVKNVPYSLPKAHSKQF